MNLDDIDYEGMDWRSKRRITAWRLREDGYSNRQIAIRLKVSEGAVSQWMSKANKDGIIALLPLKQRRRINGLNSTQLLLLAAYLEQGATSFGYGDSKWTVDRVCDLIFEKFDLEVRA